MNAKAKGSRAERRCIFLLEALGYRCAKAGASLGAFDVIGLTKEDGGKARFIQVKSGTSTLRRAERMGLEEIAPSNDSLFVEYWHWDRKWTRMERWDWRTRTWIQLSPDYSDEKAAIAIVRKTTAVAPISGSPAVRGNS